MSPKYPMEISQPKKVDEGLNKMSFLVCTRKSQYTLHGTVGTPPSGFEQKTQEAVGFKIIMGVRTTSIPTCTTTTDGSET